MNLLLLQPGEVRPDGTARLTGRRLEHAREVLRVHAGQALRVGVRGGRCGTGEVVSSSPEGLELQLTLDQPPPPRPGVDLVLAVPRPKALKRVVATVASLGVDRVALVNASRVEKSYFDSKVLAPTFLAGLVDLGLEQARDTVPPVITVHERFRPFVEDELDAWAPPDARRYLPHPSAATAIGPSAEARLVVAIGPDGGWVPFEVELLEQRGFLAVSLGPRTLRVEAAVPAVVAALRPRLGA